MQKLSKQVLLFVACLVVGYFAVVMWQEAFPCVPKDVQVQPVDAWKIVPKDEAKD